MQIQNNSNQSFGAVKVSTNISARAFKSFESNFGKEAQRVFNPEGYNYYFKNPDVETKAVAFLNDQFIPHRQCDYPEMSPWDFQRFAREPFEKPIQSQQPKAPKNPVLRALHFVFMKQTPADYSSSSSIGLK